jgi:CheY-like chemotaxis protein
MMMKKVLVIEDEKNVIDVVSAYLEKDGFKIFTTLDGKIRYRSCDTRAGFRSYV